MSSFEEQDYPTDNIDIAIIGGGMVGASMAALLPEHYNILLVESFPLPESDAAPIYQPSYDARTTALSFSSYKTFADIGLWPMLEKHVQPIKQVHVSDKGHWGSTLLDQQQKPALQALGFVIENAWLGRCLLHFIQQKPNVHFASPAQVEKLQSLADGARLEIKHKSGEIKHCQAKLAIIADGSQSKTCQQLGIHHHLTDYQHTAIVANISTSEPHQGIAYERFTDQGPLAILPLTSLEQKEHRSALIWTMATEEAEKVLALEDTAFIALLQQRFGHRQGKIINVGQRHSHPLKLSTANEQVRQHIVVLGNAAHSLHPVAGQGFNLALRDVAALCQHITEANTELGDLTTLEAYAKAQENDQLLTTLFSDVLPGLFTKKHPLIVTGRSLGLLGIELLNPLKSSFINFATGLRSS